MLKNIIISLLTAFIIQPLWKYAYTPEDIVLTYFITFWCAFLIIDNVDEFFKGVGDMNGWVKIHRKIAENWIWKEKPFDKARAFMDLIILANREDKRETVGSKIITVERGSIFTTANNLSVRWGWSRGKVLRFFKNMELNGMISTSSIPEGTLITIENYQKYQGVSRKRKEEGSWLDA